MMDCASTAIRAVNPWIHMKRKYCLVVDTKCGHGTNNAIKIHTSILEDHFIIKIIF